MNIEKNKLIDMYDVWYHPWWKSSYVYYSMWFLAILLLIFIIILIKKWWKGGYKISFTQQALQDLYRLEMQTHISEQTIHDAYFQVTMILKIYLSKRYHINLLDKTDKEIAAELQDVVPQDLVVLLQEFFDRSFQIKFAYDAVSEQMLFDDIAFAQKVIQETSAPLESAGKH